MKHLTRNEQAALLTLFKDYATYHNANTLAKLLGMSRFGAQKLLRRLESEGVLSSQRIGRAIIYKPKADDDYTRKLLIFLLADEARRHLRWQDEFSELGRKAEILILYGSAARDWEKAGDIDLLVVCPQAASRAVGALVEKARGRLPKRLHAIRMTSGDLADNLKKKNKAALDIIRKGIVLYGQDALYGVILDVACGQAGGMVPRQGEEGD